MGPSLLSAWLTCFIVSFDEIAIAHLPGRRATRPSPSSCTGSCASRNRLPVLIAMAVMLMVGTITLTLIAFRLGRRQP